MRSPSGRNVRVPVLARPLHNVLEKDTLPSQCISLTKVLATVMTIWLDVKGLLKALLDNVFQSQSSLDPER